MAASLSDQFFLGNDPQFQNRVKQAFIAACIAIQSEAPSTAFHYARSRYVGDVLQPSAIDTWKVLWSFSVATDTNCLSDATQAGTVVLTSGNAAAQAALVTDGHITAASSSQFNTFFNPAS